ncbi:glycosyltransferase family 9 protein [Sulfurospirillum sp. 1612]|uniref:glycosyltransferase family 9 protein n=1 Tax=Sulfurospirillum sp. 1612 TaxID=3094835 RepID=UPI002F922936
MKFFLNTLKKILNKVINIFYVLLGYKKVIDFNNIENILFFKVGSMGDNIITLPTIASIKKQYPNIKITILTNSGKSPVSIENLIDKSYVEEFINYTGKSKKEFVRLLQDKKFDLVIDLTQPSSLFRTVRNMIVFRYLGINKAIGWEISELSFLRKFQDKYNLVGSELERYLNLIKKYKISIDREFILNITKNEIEKIDLLIDEKDLKDKKIIAIVVGSKRITTRWPIEYFNEVIKYINTNTNYIPVIIGGNEDNILVELLKERVVNLCGKLTPLESAEFLKRVEFTISNDTGPMHLSYAVGTKVIGIFSARGFRGKWYPPKDLGIVLRDNNIECNLCYKETCEHLSCLKNITSNKIIDIIGD